MSAYIGGPAAAGAGAGAAVAATTTTATSSVAATVAAAAAATATAAAAAIAAASASSTGIAAAEKVRKTRVNLTEAQRREAIEELLRCSNKGKLSRGDFKRVAETYKCHPKQISIAWKRHEKQKADGVVAVDLGNRRKGRSGRRGINLDYLREALKDVPVEARTSQRSVAAALGIPHSTLRNNLKKLGLKATSRVLKPLSTDTEKDTRAKLDAALREVARMQQLLDASNRANPPRPGQFHNALLPPPQHLPHSTHPGLGGRVG